MRIATSTAVRGHLRDLRQLRLAGRIHTQELTQFVDLVLAAVQTSVILLNVLLALYALRRKIISTILAPNRPFSRPAKLLLWYSAASGAGGATHGPRP